MNKKPGLQPRCKTCASEDTRNWRKSKSKEYLKDRHYQNTYGITLNQFNQMWESQKGLCPICECTLELNAFTGNSAVVDHCHTSGLVRQILCNECNRGLGYFHDNPEALRKAANYLEKHLALHEAS